MRRALAGPVEEAEAPGSSRARHHEPRIAATIFAEPVRSSTPSCWARSKAAQATAWPLRPAAQTSMPSRSRRTAVSPSPRSAPIAVRRTAQPQRVLGGQERDVASAHLDLVSGAGEEHPALASWRALCDAVRGLSPGRTAELVGVSLAMRLDAHGLLPWEKQPDEGGRLAADEAARRRALERLLDRDRVEDAQVRREVFALNRDLEAVRPRLARALEAFGDIAAPGEVVHVRPAGDAPPDPVAAFAVLTGRLCPPEERAALASAREVLFLACRHLDAQSSFGRWDDRCFVYFEPPAAPAVPVSLAPAVRTALQALANDGRVAVLATLSAAGEMYAQEVVAATGLPQPTVAGHLASLLEAGLVRSERRGHRRYYAPVPEAGRQVAEAVRRLFGL